MLLPFRYLIEIIVPSYRDTKTLSSSYIHRLLKHMYNASTPLQARDHEYASRLLLIFWGAYDKGAMVEEKGCIIKDLLHKEYFQ